MLAGAGNKEEINLRKRYTHYIFLLPTCLSDTYTQKYVNMYTRKTCTTPDHTYHTKTKPKIVLPKYRLEKTQRSYKYMV